MSLRRVVSELVKNGTIKIENTGSAGNPKNPIGKSTIIVGLGLAALGAQYYISNSPSNEFTNLDDDDLTFGVLRYLSRLQPRVELICF